MALTQLNLSNFRNFSSVELAFNPKYNIFYGNNGSGKTSILEAIYYLILGRSFRSHLLRRVVKYGENSLALFGKIQQESKFITAGITKSLVAGKQIKIAGKPALSHLESIKLLPLQLLSHHSYSLLQDGPKIRRQFIDWGLFHVEQSFLELWRKFERTLEQRNSAIQTKATLEYIKIWDKDLARWGVELHTQRKRYIENFIPLAHQVLSQLACDFTVKFSYLAGWDSSVDLYSTLAATIKNDLHLGYTSVGPQRADLQITIDAIPVKDALSRGQQKLLLYGLQIAQGILLHQLTHKNCLYLVDDLLAELDIQKGQLLTEVLLNLSHTQIFVTGLAWQELAHLFPKTASERQIFHVANASCVPLSC